MADKKTKVLFLSKTFPTYTIDEIIGTVSGYEDPELLEILKEYRVFFEYAGIETFEDLGGWLNLRNTGITELPPGLTVGGYLDLSNTGITDLPEGLTVNGWLDLSNTGITDLPEGLTVGRALYLRNTGITELPDRVNIKGEIYY